jgi:hypothetical protein
MDAQPRIDAYRLAGSVLSDETVTAPQSERAEIAAIVPESGGALIAWYESKYMVTSAHATPGAGGTWAIAPIATIRMATSYAEGAPGLVVGRVYGDSIDQPGDAFVLAPDGTRTAIPTTRGVHGLAIAPDGAVWLGDGWDRNYGQNAHGLLTRCVGATCSLIEDVTGNYWVETIYFVDAGDAIVKGNAAVREYRGAGTSWTGTTIAGTVRDVAVGDGAIVIVGDKSQLIRAQ